VTLSSLRNAVSFPYPAKSLCAERDRNARAKGRFQKVVIRLDAVAAGAQNRRGVRTILLAAATLAVLTGCQSAVEKQRLEEADSGDLPNCARIRVASSGCGRNSGLTEVYVDNMHKDRAVRVTVRKHSQEGDDDTDYAIAEGGKLFVGCEGGGTSFAVVGCKVLKAEAEKG
jgi:hypothetical protein